MAITWEVTIIPLDVEKKEANITAVRTDNTNPLDIKTETHTIISAIIETKAQQSSVLDNIWAHHLAFQIKQNKIEAYLNDLANQAKNNLEARET